ncbi:hypothetical protein ABZX98_32810 [Streptomyces sp. NPDC002992]|uniref:hypothetical protein n=1 Tax=Streptomyces sp. NPDC002992 TaxID=3154273 RepID=UPI0033B6D459
MTSVRRIRIASLICAAVAAGVTGCAKSDGAVGESTSNASAAPADTFAGLTAEQIDRKARDATSGATSVRIAGALAAGSKSFELDLAVTRAGTCKGSFNDGTGTVQVRKTSETVLYIQAEETFWRAALASRSEELTPAQRDTVAEALGGHWVKADPDLAHTLGGGLCNLDKLMKPLLDGGTGSLVRAADTTVNGTPAAELIQKGDGGSTSTLNVAKEGKPYVLTLESVGGATPGKVTMSDYEKPVVVTPPPASEVVDPSKPRPGS